MGSNRSDGKDCSASGAGEIDQARQASGGVTAHESELCYSLCPTFARPNHLPDPNPTDYQSHSHRCVLITFVVVHCVIDNQWDCPALQVTLCNCVDG